MRLGIGSFCYMWAIGQDGAMPECPMRSLDLVAEAARLGVGVVQLGPNLPIAEAELGLVGAEAKRLGIELEMGMLGFEPEQVAFFAERGRRLGAKLLRTVDLYEGPSPDAAELAGSLRALLPYLEEFDIRLAVENARTPARTLRAALEAVDSPRIGVTLDTVNSLAIPEGPAEVVRNLAPFVFCLHVKDFQVKRLWHRMGFSVEGTPAGEGQLDVPWLLRQLREAGADANAILELWVPQQDTVEETVALERDWVERSIPYLRALIPD